MAHSTTDNAAPQTTEGDHDGKCPICGHEASGVEPPRYVNRRRAKKGKPPIFAYCYADIANHGFGDVESCDCTDLSHANRIR